MAKKITCDGCGFDITNYSTHYVTLIFTDPFASTSLIRDEKSIELCNTCFDKLKTKEVQAFEEISKKKIKWNN